MRIVDLFSGAGGLTFGFYYRLWKNGFVRNRKNQIIFANEFDDNAAEAFMANYPEINMINCDIRTLTEQQINGLIGDAPVDLIIGGPPCQSYSTVGARCYDDKAMMYTEYSRILNIVRPKMFLFENVKGILSMRETFYKLDENGNIVYNNDLIKLFIGNNLEEPNNLLNLIYEGKTHLNDKIETLYAYWDILEERFKMQPLKTKLAFLEEALNSNMVILNPDEYLLEGDILNSYYDNRKFQNTQNINLVKQIREEYSKMKHNYQKTIPYVKGSYEGYTYETLKANDPTLFAMGSASDCCFKIGGDADNFVRYCAENVNGRVLAIKNSKGKIVAMAPMVRNGNLILCNSIESTMTSNQEFMKKMFEMLEEAGNKMIELSSHVESEQDKIHALLVGSYKNEIDKFDKYESLKYGEISDKCLYPLDQSIYANMGGFDNKNYIIAKVPNLDYDNLRSFEPSYLYSDPRKEVIELEIEYMNIVNGGQ